MNSSDFMARSPHSFLNMLSLEVGQSGQYIFNMELLPGMDECRQFSYCI